MFVVMSQTKQESAWFLGKLVISVDRIEISNRQTPSDHNC